MQVTASSNGVWTATPETNATWTSKVLYVSNATGEVGFTDSTNSSSNIVTSGFRFYGNFALLKVSGTMQASWNAKNTSVEDVFSLGWGSVDDNSDLTAVMLRNVAPMTSPDDDDN